MPSYVSVEGVWKAARESASMENTFGKTIESEFIIAGDGSHIVKPGEKFLYNGPDREAVKALVESGEKSFGQNFRNDPEFLQATRNLNFKSVEDYLESIGYDSEKEVTKQEALIHKVNKHELPEKHDEILELAGGRDFSGNKNNNLIGGFGEERVRKADEIVKPRRGRPPKQKD